MYARTTVVRARTSAVDAGIAEVRNTVMPAIKEMDGFLGYSMLIARESGRCIVTTSWRDEAAMAESRDQVMELRRQMTETLGGSEPEIREWEISTLHRARGLMPGSYARGTWLQVPRDMMDLQVEVYRSTVLPRLQELYGFCSASLLIDRVEGRTAGAVVFENQSALEATREIAGGIRRAAIEQTGSTVLDVAEFEVALAHLRVPEHV